MEYDNTNRGVLFKAEKETEKHPDYTGKINVGGTDYLLAAWIKESKAGKKFMSLSVKPDRMENNRKQASGGGADQDIPFGPVSKFAP